MLPAFLSVVIFLLRGLAVPLEAAVCLLPFVLLFVGSLLGKQGPNLFSFLFLLFLLSLLCHFLDVGHTRPPPVVPSLSILNVPSQYTTPLTLLLFCLLPTAPSRSLLPLQTKASLLFLYMSFAPRTPPRQLINLPSHGEVGIFPLCALSQRTLFYLFRCLTHCCRKLFTEGAGLSSHRPLFPPFSPLLSPPLTFLLLLSFIPSFSAPTPLLL